MKVEPLTKIWLEFNGNKFMLPVNPKKIDTKKKSKPDEYDIVGKGQIAVPQYPDLKTYKWESFFPGHADDPYTIEEAMDIPDYCEILDNAMNEVNIGYLTINRPSGFNEHTRVIITAFNYQDVGGEALDITFINKNLSNCLLHVGCRNVHSCMLCIVCISDSCEHIGDYV